MDIATRNQLEEIKRQLEEVAGRKINAGAEQLLMRSFVVASSTYLTDSTVAWVTNERIFLPAFSCADTAIVDTSGVTETGSDGKATFRLRNFLCDRIGGPGVGVQFAEPINLLATAQGPNPNYLTMTHELVRDDPNLSYFSDVEITAYSWNPDGTAASGVHFYWRCRAIASAIIE